MKEFLLFAKDREKEFYHWLSSSMTAKQISDLFIALPIINEYGKHHNCFKETIFEIKEKQVAQQLQQMVQKDKRFQFVHYGQSRSLLLLLQKYCEFFESKDNSPKMLADVTLIPKSVQESDNTELQIPAQLMKTQKTQESEVSYKGNESVVIKTKSGATYSGSSPAEAFASYCDKLAQGHPAAFCRLIDETYYGSGSVVLYGTEPSGGGVRVNKGFCYVDRSLSKQAAEYYGKWLCKMLGDLDLPVSVTVFDKKPEGKDQKKQIVGSPGKVEEKKITAPVTKQDAAATPAASLWRDTALQPIASKKQNAVTEPITTSQSGLDKDLEALLVGKEYAQLRDELVSQKVTSFAQFKALDLWAFMNWAGLYSIGRRQEICKQIKEMLEPQKEENTGKQYCLKTKKGECYYGNSPAKALANYYDDLAPRTPLTIRKLIGRRYNDIGMVVLHTDMPKDGGIQLSNPTAYLSSDLNERSALYYAIWLCRKCGELDEPVSLTEVAKEDTTNKPEAAQPKVEEKPQEKAIEKQDDLIGEEWLFAMLAKKSIQYEDKRNNKGCLWIFGGHELDEFVKWCATKGYKFTYKADGYKAFKKGPAWWTVNRSLKQQEAENGELEGPKHTENLSLIETVTKVLSKSEKPMTVAEIYTEIKSKNLFKFSIGNPHLTINAAIRKSCKGAFSSDHSPNDIFGCMYDQQGIAQYYLLEKSERESGKIKATEDMVELSDQQPADVSTQASSSPVTSYIQKQIEQTVLEADLAGITKDALAAKVRMSLAAIKKEVNANNNIVEICEKLIHKDAFVDWDQAADQLEKILDKLMLKNNGYVSKASLYEFARADMQMFMNDNNMDDQSKIYDMAVHLFSKEHYHGITYAFSNWQHISKLEANLSTNLSVMIKFAREQGGFFKLEDLISYLESVKIGTGNLHVQMKMYDKPIFLFYAEHEYALAETMGINNGWLLLVKRAFDKLFMDMGDHVVLRNIQPVWYYQLPSLPNGRPWTALLLQSVLRHYSKDLDGVHTIYALSNQSGDVLHAMVVTADSEVQTFPDAIISVLVDEHIEKRQFDAEELRKLLLQRGLIEDNELMWTMPKATANDSRFIWSSNGQTVTINI